MQSHKKHIKKPPNVKRGPIQTGDKQISNILDGIHNSSQIVSFSVAMAKVSVQSTGTLNFTYAPSINGQNFDTPISVNANQLSSYNTHNISSIQINWISGSGYVVLVGVGG